MPNSLVSFPFRSPKKKKKQQQQKTKKTTTSAELIVESNFVHTKTVHPKIAQKKPARNWRIVENRTHQHFCI
jgi:hypothetical protein